ncbi:glycosyltransferase family 2 protein [bacterium D16-76]|nr:glycosyltransferase family 2 protein [bacterium D16-76]
MDTGQKNIDVSVVVPTYCQERFVAQALDSILEQQTDLQYEVLIGDDASTDKTPEILVQYAQEHPSRITLILREKNVGITKNVWDLYRKAKGKYISILQGDDYWIDANKLQKQWELLEAHPEYIGCGGKSLVVNEDNVPDYTQSPHFTLPKRVFTLEDFLDTWQLPAQQGTWMFRNIFSGDGAQRYSILYQAHRHLDDKTMALLLLSKGSFYCSYEPLSAYRFVDKSGEHNWFSIHHTNPYRNYDMFMYPCKLETWARKNIDLPRTAHLGKRNPYRFARFVEECVKRPELKRFRYLLEMIVHSHQPMRYSWYVLKALIEME